MLTVACPLLLPLLVYLIGAAMGANEQRTYPRRHPSAMITPAELQRQDKDWMRHLDQNWVQVPIIARVWHPPTLNYEMRPTTKWVRKSSQG